MKYLVVFFFVMATATGCEIPICCDPGPPGFMAVIRTTEGIDYLTSNAGKPIDIYYEGENEQDEKTDVRPITFLHGDTTKLEVVNISSRSIQGIKTFYLKVGSDIDTLYVDVDKKRNKFRSVHFNGQPAQEITNPKAGTYWLMQK